MLLLVQSYRGSTAISFYLPIKVIPFEIITQIVPSVVNVILVENFKDGNLVTCSNPSLIEAIKVWFGPTIGLLCCQPGDDGK